MTKQYRRGVLLGVPFARLAERIGVHRNTIRGWIVEDGNAERREPSLADLQRLRDAVEELRPQPARGRKRLPPTLCDVVRAVLDERAARGKMAAQR